MKVKEIKNPLFVIFLTWILLIVMNWGIPVKFTEEIINPEVNYLVSFLLMNFDFIGNQTNIIILIISWIITDAILIIFFEYDTKFSIKIIISQVFLLVFSLVFLNNIDKNLKTTTYFQENIGGLFIGFALTLVFIIPISVIKILILKYSKTESKQLELSNIIKTPISKCPHCGQEYDSDPKICYNCSKEIY